MIKGSTIFRVEFRAGGNHNFDTIAAIFEMFEPRTLGVTASRLYHIGIQPEKPYKNKICTISKELLLIKKSSKRGNPALKNRHI